MKKLIYAIAITCIGTILIQLNTKEHNQPITESPVAVVEALVEPIPPEVVPEPIPAVEPVPEPPTSVPQPAVMSGDCSLVNNYTDWPTNIAYAVCMAESGGRVMAHNAGDNHGSCVGSYSLMQVGCFWYPYYGYSSADYYNPQVNIEIAHNIWKRQGGFNAWSAYKNGSYRKYL